MKRNHPIWKISNLISLGRIFLAIPVALALWYDDILWFLIFAVMAMATDFLDGYLARKRNEISELGKILDPLADKIVVGVTVLMILITGKMPLWLGIAIFLRDILILLGSAYAKKRLGIILASNMTGKVAVNVITLELFLLIFEVDFAYTWGAYITLIFLVYSLISYLVAFLKRLREAKA